MKKENNNPFSGLYDLFVLPEFKNIPNFNIDDEYEQYENWSSTVFETFKMVK